MTQVEIKKIREELSQTEERIKQLKVELEVEMNKKSDIENELEKALFQYRDETVSRLADEFIANREMLVNFILNNISDEILQGFFPEKKSSNDDEFVMPDRVRELKKKHPDVILLFRCGDFYESYGEDAEECSKILGITLTKRTVIDKGKNKGKSYMAGFPFHALDTYLPKLIRYGKRVAIHDNDDIEKNAVNHQ